MGIDPGSRIAGYGIIDIDESASLHRQAFKAVAAGFWKLYTSPQLPSRLAALALEFRRVVDVYKPTHAAVELSFVAENPKTALILGHARGVILSEAYQAGLVISEISATEVKKMIAGDGRAHKKSVAQIISTLLDVDVEKLPYDATDAMAIAYAQALKNKGWGASTSQLSTLNSWKQVKEKNITSFFKEK
jgi:crossover junction endodeoxyribonuclease RuvC